MKTEYKVWITIEKIVIKEDGETTYEDVAPFPVSLGPFDSFEDADAEIIILTGETTKE